MGSKAAEGRWAGISARQVCIQLYNSLGCSKALRVTYVMWVVSCDTVVGELKTAPQGSSMSNYLVSLASPGEEVDCECLVALNS